uniref:VOC domain-containing protein n=2 Tax=Cucumis sativus TaxID=3659 RepID=A0A0A0LZB1_CUCSA
MSTTEKQLKEMRIEYVKCEVEDEGIFVDQLFFHDPDGLMIEICNCENLPILPVSGGGDSPTTATNAARFCSIQQAEEQQKLKQIQSATVQRMQLQQLLINIPCNAWT